MSVQTKIPANRNMPDWVANKSILIVNSDTSFGLELARTLSPDGHKVLGPVATLSGAYRIILDDKPDIAILDGDMEADQTARLSDMLLMMGVPHLVASRNRHRLTRLSYRDNKTTIADLPLQRSLIEEITHAVWDIHSRSMIFDILTQPELDVAV